MAETLADKLFDLEARIEGVFPLTIGDPEGAPDWFEDFCEDCDSASKQVFERFEPLSGYINEHDYPTPEEVADTICMNRVINGWVCRIAWCQRRYLGNGIFQSGWGLTRWKWVWGQTADEAVANALILVSEDHESSEADAAA